MWNKDLVGTVNVDNGVRSNPFPSIEFGLLARGFFPYPRVEKLTNSQECGVAESPRNCSPFPLKNVWKSGAGPIFDHPPLEGKSM
jgi:hypothetical protein